MDRGRASVSDSTLAEVAIMLKFQGTGSDDRTLHN